MQKSVMRWDDLRVILAVARQSRLLNAGRSLGLDPVTVSRRIAALEEALGTKLFERSAAGLRHLPRRRCSSTRRRWRAGQRRGRGGRRPGRPTVGHRADRGAGRCRNYLLIGACDALSRANGPAGAGVVALPRMFSLYKREADLAITVSPPTAGRLTVRKIAAYPSLDRAERSPRSGRCALDDLREVRGIGYISDMIFDKELDYYALLGREPDPSLTSNSLMVQLRWCLHGVGVCILLDFVARAHCELVAVLPHEIQPHPGLLPGAPPGRRARRADQPHRRGGGRLDAGVTAGKAPTTPESINPGVG